MGDKTQTGSNETEMGECVWANKNTLICVLFHFWPQFDTSVSRTMTTLR